MKKKKAVTKSTKAHIARSTARATIKSIWVNLDNLK